MLSYNDDSRKTIVVVTNGLESLRGNGARGLSVQCNIFLSCVHLREPLFLPGFVEKFVQLKFGWYVLSVDIEAAIYIPCTSMYPYNHCPMFQAAVDRVSVFFPRLIIHQLRFACVRS